MTTREIEATIERLTNVRKLWPQGMTEAAVVEAELLIRALATENERLRAGLHRLAAQDYDRGYSPEDYAQAVLDGHEPLNSHEQLSAEQSMMCESCGSSVSEKFVMYRCDCTKMQRLRPIPQL